jgi:hypothetical protein
MDGEKNRIVCEIFFFYKSGDLNGFFVVRIIEHGASVVENCRACYAVIVDMCLR